MRHTCLAMYSISCCVLKVSGLLSIHNNTANPIQDFIVLTIKPQAGMGM